MIIQGPFQIKFERSGGFAGISTSLELNSSEMTEEDCSTLKQLIDHSGFHDHNEENAGSGRADGFQYLVTIVQNKKERRLILKEPAVPDSFRPLLNYLSEKARNRNPGEGE